MENSSLKEDRVLVIYLPDCHESLAGIVAGRIPGKILQTYICSDECGRGCERLGAFDRYLSYV